jgi:DNA-binding MarR family transcriptional regulator
MKMQDLNVNGVVGQVARIRERANLLIERELAARGVVGIVPAHGSVLQFLLRQDRPVPIKAVVVAVGRVKSTVTGILNTLARHGYVRKSPSEEDGRVTYVELTEKGRALREDFDEISRKLLDRLYGTMPQADRQVLVRLLAQLEENLARPGGGA